MASAGGHCHKTKIRIKKRCNIQLGSAKPLTCISEQYLAKGCKLIRSCVHLMHRMPL